MRYDASVAELKVYDPLSAFDRPVDGAMQLAAYTSNCVYCLQAEPIVTRCARSRLVIISALFSTIATPVHAELVAAVLPAARVAVVGRPITVYATVINSGEKAVDATGCYVALDSELPAHFSYQTTNPHTNVVSGLPNTPVPIPANTAKSFVLLLEPWAAIESHDVHFVFACDNVGSARTLPAVNTLLLSATTLPAPDVITMGISISGTGVVPLNAQGNVGDLTGAFALVAMNIGSAGDDISLQASSPTQARLSVCPSDSKTGECTQPPSAGPLATPLGENTVSTYSVFVETAHRLALDPVGSRINVQFTDGAGQIRGATSIALASTRRRWEAWHDRSNGGSTLRAQGEVIAPSPCHEAVVAVASEKHRRNDHLNLKVDLVAKQFAGLSCPQVLTYVPVDFVLASYTGAHSGVVIRTQNRQPIVVDVLDTR